MMERIKIFSAIFYFCMFAMNIQAQSYYSSDSKEYRVALVIGNSEYQMGYLANPVNDARSIAQSLRNVGFEVLLYENTTSKDEMKMAVREFGKKLRMNRGIGLFYFAGHGVQVDGFNYLIPVNANIFTEEEVEYEAIDVGFILAQMESAENRVNIIILDACRNNPFARSFRSANRGLATINAPTGSIIAYATSPGSTASDGSGQNGLYTEALLKQLEKEDLKIEEVFKNVRAEVIQKSAGQQTPWESSSLVGDFYFNKDFNISDQTVSAPAPIIDNFTWKATKKGTKSICWVYHNGRDISKEVQVEVKGKDLKVYHPKTDKTFLLVNYSGTYDNIERSVQMAEPQASVADNRSNQTVVKHDKVEWRAVKGYYWIYLNGVEISKETTNQWKGKDLKVYHKKTGKTYQLKNFNDCLDNQLRPAFEIK